MHFVNRFSQTTSEGSVTEVYSPPASPEAPPRTTPQLSFSSTITAMSQRTRPDHHPPTPPEEVGADEVYWPDDDDPDGWYDTFLEDDEVLEVTDDLPTDEQMEEAGEMPIYDADGNTRPFRNLYIGDEHQGRRQMLIFVRHIFCGSCQAYLRHVTEAVTPSAYFSLPIPTTITIITCCQPHLLAGYAEKTACPFRMYTDPSRRLYKSLGMSWKLSQGSRPLYGNGKNQLQVSVEAFAGMAKQRPRRDGLRGGMVLQIGGEFLFEDGRPIWCHRMPHMRGHAEISVLRKVLGMGESESGEEDDVRAVLGFDPRRPSMQRQRPAGTNGNTPGRVKLIWDGPGKAHLGRESRAE